jgi:hypothetical protein
MYKCGWNGCEKAYGTLNHLNAHVTMQAHGTKRTPEGEFALLFHSLWFPRVTNHAKFPFDHVKQMQDPLKRVFYRPDSEETSLGTLATLA